MTAFHFINTYHLNLILNYFKIKLILYFKIQDTNFKINCKYFETVLSNIMLGTKLQDMTSCYQGIDANVVKEFVNYPLLSRGHFYQTE